MPQAPHYSNPALVSSCADRRVPLRAADGASPRRSPGAGAARRPRRRPRRQVRDSVHPYYRSPSIIAHPTLSLLRAESCVEAYTPCPLSIHQPLSIHATLGCVHYGSQLVIHAFICTCNQCCHIIGLLEIGL